jgi:sec-independent protein translocase protein TatB
MNIFGMGPMEVLLIVILALIVFGPAKLPEIMGQVGRAIGDFRRATSDLSEEFNKTIQAELQETRSVVDEARSALGETRAIVSDVHSTVNNAVVSSSTPTQPTASQEGLPPLAINGTTVTETLADGTSTAMNGALDETNGAGSATGAAQDAPNAAGAEDATPHTASKPVQWSWDTAESPATEASTEPAAAETTPPPATTTTSSESTELAVSSPTSTEQRTDETPPTR